MDAVVRLLTFVDVRDGDDDRPRGRRMSVSARHEAVLADGRHVVLLDDRGWTAELRFAGGGEQSEQERGIVESPGIWAYATAEEIEHTARAVVGPDEPSEGRTRADMEASHWDYLARRLRQQGVEAEAGEMSTAPHDVELSDRVIARLGIQSREIT